MDREQKIKSFLRETECNFGSPFSHFQSDEDVTSFFNSFINSRLKATEVDIKCILPVFYRLESYKEGNWKISNEVIPFDIEDNELRMLLEKQEELTKNSGQESFSKKTLTSLNNTPHNYNIIIKNGDETQITKQSDNIFFTIKKEDRLYKFRNNEEFIARYSKKPLFGINNLDAENRDSEFVKFCKEILLSASHHTIYLEEDNDALYYIFSSPVVEYDERNIIKNRYGLGGLFILVKNSNDNDNEYIEECIKNCKRLIDKVSNILISYYYLDLTKQESLKSAIAAIMSRNMSHNLGSHVISGTKNYIANKFYELPSAVDGRGIYHLFQYLQERMDYVSMVINSSHNGYFFNAPLNLKADILDAFAVDGRDKRHNEGVDNKQTKSFLLDYIVRSEHIVRPEGSPPKKTDDNKSQKIERIKKEGEIDLEIMLLLEENDKIYSFSSEANGDNDTNIFNKINFSVPFGLNSRHAFLTILENYIRNTAKHNKSGETETLVISVFVKENPEKKDEYIIKIFNNRKEETFDGNKKLKEIKILKEDGSLDTENKGIKEMLICASWLKGKTNWSNLDGEKNMDIFTYEDQKLQDIHGKIQKVEKEVEEKLNAETEEEHKKVIKKQLDSIRERLNYYKDDNKALAIQFTLPKHKWVCYKKIEQIKEVYDLPSADFYAIEAKSDQDKIKNILPHVIFVETEKNKKINFKNETETLFSVCFINSDENKDKNYLQITRHNNTEHCYSIEKTKKRRDNNGNEIEEIVKENVEFSSDIILEDAINNEEILKLCYEYLYDKDVDNRKIFIRYANPNNIKSEKEEYRILRNDKEDLNIEEIDFGKIQQNDAYVFNNHNDTPYNFADSYDIFRIKLPHKKFIEGISGASYNYNLLINAPVKQLNYYKILEACDTKIAIVDERIYTKYRNLVFEGKISVDTKKEYNKKLAIATSFNDLVDSECKDYLLQYVCNERSDLLGTISEINNLIKEKYQIPITQTFNKAFLEAKEIYVYNYDKDKNQLIDLDGKYHDKPITEKFDYISVHYSILLDKFESKKTENDISTKYTDFIGRFIQNKDNLRRVIHSGRGGISDVANSETFITLSTIEACVEDCKYKLSQLFLNLKYK